MALICLSIFYSVSSSQVKVENDIVYTIVLDKLNQKQQLKLDFYSPVTSQYEKQPVIILVHGGGFALGDKQQKLYGKMATQFAQKGYVVFSVNYRLKPISEPFAKTVLDQAVNDVNLAIKWIIRNKRKYHLDVTKLFLCGDSAGGAIVVNTAFQENPPLEFAGCIDLWGGLPEGGSWDAPIDKFLILKDKTVPVCIVHGTKDSVIPIQTSLNFNKKLKEYGILCEFYAMKDAAHYPEARSEEFTERIFAFADRIVEYKSNNQNTK